MAEILNWNGRKYIRWSMGQPPVGGAYIPVSDAQFEELQRRVEANRSARIVQSSTPVNLEATGGRAPEWINPTARVRGNPDTPLLDVIQQEHDRQAKLTYERLKKQRRVGGQVDHIFDLEDAAPWTPPKPTDPRFWSHLGEDLPRSGYDSSLPAQDARETAWLVRDQHNWTRTTERTPYRVRKVEDDVYEQMTNRAALQDDIAAIRFRLKNQDLNTLEEKALRVEMNHKMRLVNELHGKIRPALKDALSADQTPLKEFEAKLVAEMMEEDAGELVQVQDVPNRDLQDFDDHISRPHKLLIDRYEQEIARERMSVSTARRYFMVSSARDTGLGQLGYRGTRPYGMVEFGDYVQYQQVGDERVVKPDAGSPGIWLRDRDVLPSPVLDQISHSVLPTEVAEHVRGDLRPELQHMITGYFKADKRGDDRLEEFLDETDVIGRRISSRFDEAFERLGGTDPTDAMRADLETAKSLYMGTLYDAPGTRANPDRGFSIDERGVSSREHMRGILVDDDRDPFLRNLLYDVAPELRDEVERKGQRVAGKRLQGLLGRSASRMRVAADKKGVARAVNERVRRKRQIETAQRRIGSSLDALYRDSQGNEYNAAMNRADRELARRPKALPPTQSVIDELFGLGDDETIYFQDDILDSLNKKMKEFAQAKKHDPALERAFAMATDMQPTDMAMIAADMTPQELARYKLDDVEIRAYRHLSKAAKSGGTVTPDVQARARAYVDRRLHKPRTSKEKGIDALQRAKNADKKAMEDAEKAIRKMEQDTADALDFLEPHKRSATLRSITATGVSEQDAGFILDLMQRSPDNQTPINPMVGGSRGEVMHQLGILSDSNAVISMEGGAADSRFMSQFVIESVRDASDTAAARAGAGNLSEIDVTYRATGDVAQTLANAGVASNDAARMAIEGDPAVFTQRYKYQRIKANNIDFAIDRSALEAYEEMALDKLQWTFPDEEPDVLRARVRAQIDDYVTNAPEELKSLIASHVDVGRYVPIENTARIADLQSEAYVSRVLESAYGGANTVTSDNARYSDGLIKRIFEMQSPYGRRYLGEHGKKSLFDIARDADGNKQLVMNELFNPTSQPHQAMEMDSTVRSVLDEITEKMGGIDQVEEMIKASSVDTFDLPRSVLNEVSMEKRGDGRAFVDTSRYTTGPVSTGTHLDISYNAGKETLDEIEQRYGFRPEDRRFRSTIGEVFAEALNARREEAVTGTPIRTEGAEPVRPRSSRIIDDLIVGPAKEHMDTLKDERLVNHMTPEQSEAFGVRKMAESAEEGAEHLKRSGFKFATMEDMGKLFKENKSLRYGAVAVGGLAAWGAYRNHRAKKDHTFEDQRGPAHLPGGSPYENPPQGFTNENTPSFADQSGGVTYHVDARGQFDPNALATAMNTHVGGSVQMNIQHNPDPIRQRSQKMEDMINGY